MYKNVMSKKIKMTAREVAVFNAPSKPPSDEERQRHREKFRSVASLSRRDFVMSITKAGILPVNEAVLAARGEWPNAFASAISSMDEDAKLEVQIDWASATEIRRNHPIIDVLATSVNLTPEQVDALFGYDG